MISSRTPAKGLADREAGTVIVFGRLKPGLTLDVANARLQTLSQQMAMAAAENKDQAITVSPLPRMSTSTSPSTDAGLGVASAALMGLAGTVLLIACLNLANMLLARGTLRKKEMAIRLALGGARGRIVRQLLTESMLLAAAGAAAGLVLAYWSTSFIVASLARVLPLAVMFETRPDMNVILATSAFVAIAALIAGVGPALRFSRPDLVTDLKEQAADAGARPGRFSARNVMVVAQLALSLGLLSGGGLFARSALKAADSDPGFSYDRAILALLDPSVAQIKEPQGRELYRAILERVRSTPGVEAASLASNVPFGDFHEGRQVERPGIRRDPTLDERRPTASSARITSRHWAFRCAAGASSRPPRKRLPAHRVWRSSTTCSPDSSSRTRSRSASGSGSHLATGIPTAPIMSRFKSSASRLR